MPIGLQNSIFSANDIAKILGYKNPKKAINKHVNEEDWHDWSCVDFSDEVSNHTSKSAEQAIYRRIGKQGNTKFVTLKGVNSLIINARINSKNEEFSSWLKSDLDRRIEHSYQCGLHIKEHEKIMADKEELLIKDIKHLKNEGLSETKLKELANEYFPLEYYGTIYTLKADSQNRIGVIENDIVESDDSIIEVALDKGADILNDYEVYDEKPVKSLLDYALHRFLRNDKLAEYNKYYMPENIISKVVSTTVDTFNKYAEDINKLYKDNYAELNPYLKN